MPAIDISSAMFETLLSGWLSLNVDTSASSDYRSWNFASSTCSIELHSGTQKTTFTNITGQDNATRLCTWSFWPSVNYNLGLSSRQTNSRTVVFKSRYTLASATGNATWFKWQGIAQDDIDYTSVAQTSTNGSWNTRFMITGSVGGVGSGADLIMQGVTSPNPVSIVSGQRYKLENLQFTFPRTWTY